MDLEQYFTVVWSFDELHFPFLFAKKSSNYQKCKCCIETLECLGLQYQANIDGKYLGFHENSHILCILLVSLVIKYSIIEGRSSKNEKATLDHRYS